MKWLTKKKALDCWANSPCQKKKKLLIAEQILLVRRQRKKYGEYAYIIMLECKGIKTDNRECMCTD